MRFLNLTIENLGVFRGQHHFDLASLNYHRDEVHAHSNRRSLIVIVGHNGAGKSTLFQALALALQGSLALGDRVSRQSYSDFLLGRLHRRIEAGEPTISDNGLVRLSFQYIQSGQPLRIQTERQWQRAGQNTLETLQVTQNGNPIDVDTTDYQTWLNDLFPPGLLSLCFFDAEKLDSLSSPEQYEKSLGEILYRLLGLDLVERLQSDLTQHSTRLSGGRKLDTLRDEVARYQAMIDMLDGQIKHIQSEITGKNTAVSDLEKTLAQKERQLAAEGGHYAARRTDLQERLKEIRSEVERVSVQLRDLSADLLPFAFVPELCARLNNSLADERRILHNRIANELLYQRLEHIKSVVGSTQFWDNKVPDESRQNLTQKLLDLLDNQPFPDDTEDRLLIHQLSEPDQARIQGWVAAALETVPQQVQNLGRYWREIQAERARIELDLERAPSEEVLVPLHTEIAEVQATLGQVRQEQTELKKQLGALEFQRDEQFQQLQRAVNQLEAVLSVERQQELADRSRSVLRVYQDALVRRRLKVLEKELVGAFNGICRKEYLLSRVEINPDNFHVQLYNENGTELKLNDFSAGERQLYALALLQALRRVSGRQLPLIIDTPLARLDETHRQRFIQDYLPHVSDQVILFVTDAEMDTDLFDLANPHLVRVYHLDFDGESGKTAVKQQDYCSDSYNSNTTSTESTDFAALEQHVPSSPASHNGMLREGEAADYGI